MLLVDEVPPTEIEPIPSFLPESGGTISMRTFVEEHGDNCFRKFNVLVSLESDHTISTIGNDQVCSVLVALSVTARCCFVAHLFLRHVLLALLFLERRSSFLL
ncbi:unnamed protein product [Brugia timori]|uniref:Uncharacterized protein n=1 Tax=Brugia timori TaxID=42155 RepID=A0A0R3Q3V0_9BILA|nr:unnamed protein product [Brugia timori]